jgi:hypothetical protein
LVSGFCAKLYTGAGQPWGMVNVTGVVPAFSGGLLSFLLQAAKKLTATLHIITYRNL